MKRKKNKMRNNQKDNNSVPFEYMVDKRKVILDNVKERNSIPKAWEVLTEKLPELSGLMKLNTFKGYVKTLKMIDEIMDKNEKNKQEKEEIIKSLDKNMEEKKDLENKLDEVRIELEKLDVVKQENNKLKKRLDEIRQKGEIVYSELDKVRQEKRSLEKRIGQVSQGEKKSSILTIQEKNIEGDIPNRLEGWGVQLKGNYYRLFKKIKGKVKWIHIGIKWDKKIAKKKIKDFIG